jgi:hypothetical protein
MAHPARTSQIIETVAPFTMRADLIRPATQVRSTLLISSQSSLRARGLYDQYLALVDPAERHVLTELVAGTWCPIDVGFAHYAACDRLALPNDTLLAIGRDVEERLRGSILFHFVRMSKQAGADPITMLVQGRRFWDRLFVGSELGVFRLGPKDLRLEIAGFPFTAFTYNRVTFRAIVESLVNPFCTRAFVRDAPEAAGRTTIGWRVSWV